MCDGRHIVSSDSNGDFYCRAVNAVLNYKKDQQVCGIGCPCFVSAKDGCFVCRYEDGSSFFPTVEGFDIRLARAYAYAAQAHRRQNRKGTKIPYFTHIITTMNYAMELTDDIEVLQAAILHDTVEDTTVTFKDLKYNFGDRVAMLVAAETEDKRHDLPAPETWDIRKQETISNLKDKPYDAKIVVLADKTANAEALVREWRQSGDEIWNKFNQKDKKRQEWYFRSIIECLYEFYDTGVMKKFVGYINEIFGEKEQNNS